MCVHFVVSGLATAFESVTAFESATAFESMIVLCFDNVCFNDVYVNNVYFNDAYFNYLFQHTVLLKKIRGYHSYEDLNL